MSEYPIDSDRTHGRKHAVLIIDDDPSSLEMIDEYLEGYDLEIMVATDGETGLERAEYGRPDLILLDVLMPGIDGFETCRRLKGNEITKDIPVIFMTALGSIDDKVRGFETGAVDYIIKPIQHAEVLARITTHLNIRDLTRKLEKSRSELEIRVVDRTAELVAVNRQLNTEIVERKRMEAALKFSEKKYRSIFENAVEGVFQAAADGRFLSVSPSLAAMLKYESPADMIASITHIGRQCYVHEDDFKTMLRVTSEKGVIRGFETRFYQKDGADLWANLSVREVRDDGGRLLYYEGFIMDVSARKQAEEDTKRLEEQLRQTRKMEVLGNLVGGIAHDFNNLLQGMLGNMELLLFKKTKNDPDYKYLANIERFVSRAIELVRRLLTFSRKMEIKPRLLDLNETVKDTIRLLERTIPKMVAIETRCSPDLWKIRADPTQMEQVMMNLTTNAVDAMNGRGTIIIETENISIDTEYIHKYPELECADYLLLKVSDTGPGMDGGTIKRIFEPFFTTKPPGKGTGLGLSTVYGIVKGHRGHITCYSQAGAGTVFNIYLPAARGAGEIIRTIKGPSGPLSGGTETILAVDDEEEILNIVVEILEKYGYTLIRAQSGEEAIDIYAREKDKIDLVILDLGMPGMGGEKCLEALCKIDPAVGIIVASGYTSHKIAQSPEAYGAALFLSKPYQLNILVSRVREVLDRKG